MLKTIDFDFCELLSLFLIMSIFTLHFSIVFIFSGCEVFAFFLLTDKLEFFLEFFSELIFRTTDEFIALAVLYLAQRYRALIGVVLRSLCSE